MLPKTRPLFPLLIAICLGLPLQRAGAAQDAPRIELAALSAGAEQEVKGDILPFWLKYTRDADDGGYYGFIGADMTVKKGASRGSLLTSRVLWTFSTAYRTYHDPAYLEMATYAYHDLVEHFWDKEDGGIFWTITGDAKPEAVNKLIYGEVFGIYGLAEYYRATGDRAALDSAISIYNLVEKNAHDPKYGGYYDLLDRKWGRMGPMPHSPMGDAAKSQNSHIHIMEAYTELLRVWPDAGLRANLRALVDMTIQHIIDPRTHHLILFMKEDWTPVSDGVSYGHDIELSWLLDEAAGVLGDPALIARTRAISLDIARATLAEGIDPDGGVINEGGPHGYTDTDKDWWPQAEAAIGFLNAYQLSGEPRFLEASRHSWEFIQARFVDRKYGDWIEKVKRDGTPVPRPKVTLWKCPYHSSRSCFELMDRVRELTEERFSP
ncbi:MAG: AGE family epimerase/isomerase [Opitutaceae bacterium]